MGEEEKKVKGRAAKIDRLNTRIVFLPHLYCLDINRMEKTLLYLFIGQLAEASSSFYCFYKYTLNAN